LINLIFKFVADSLSFLANKTGLTYNEINIILYYFIIPFSWLFLLDIILDIHYLKVSFVVFTSGFIVGCRDFKSFSDRLFDKSVTFLNYFNKSGSNYILSSVFICILVPILIYMILFVLIL
jgi:hypothetical protein